LRAWGRTYNEDGTYQWVAAETTPDGDNSLVYLTQLIQVLKLARNESPFFANWGIPAQQSVVQQIFPDLYVQETQQQFAPFFLALMIASVDGPAPYYKISVTTTTGWSTAVEVPR
jgi:hypothetical protein